MSTRSWTRYTRSSRGNGAAAKLSNPGKFAKIGWSLGTVKQLILGFALMCVTVTAVAQSRQLPDFGSPADATLSRNQEAQIGRSVVAQLRAAGLIAEDPKLTEYVQSLGSRIAGHAGNSGDQSFTFFVINDASINAFALPGGYIGIHTGLILATENESELAGVLAHEIAHVTQRHIARSIHDSQRTGIISMAAMVAALLLGVATDMPTDALQGVAMASQAAAMQRQINFTRANEHEADRVGTELLAAAGFDPYAMASFFEKLARRYGSSNDIIPALLRTHPVTTDRIAEARSRARLLPPTSREDSTNYQLTRARLKVSNARTPAAALAEFGSGTPDTLGAPDLYGTALAMMRASRHAEAANILGRLVGESPAVIWYRIAYAEALAADSRSEEAMQVYEDGMSLFPRNVPLTLSHAEALINAGQPGVAHRILLDLLNNVRGGPTPEQIRLIARAANAQGDTASAHHYMAEYYVSVGQLPLAVTQLRMALEVPDLHAVDRARYEARLEEVREYMPENERRRSSSRP